MIPGNPTTFTAANGKPYTISAIVPELLFKLRDWIADVEDCLPINHWKRAKDEGVYNSWPEAKQIAWRDRTEFLAKQIKGFTPGCELYNEYITNLSALAFWVGELLKEHHPDISEAEALIVALSPGFQEAMAICFGQEPAPPPNGAAPLPESNFQQWSKKDYSIGKEPSGLSGSTTILNPASSISVSPSPKSS